MAEDDAFLRQFAVQIAAALREKEDSQQQGQGKQKVQNQPSIDESVEELYRSLVFDEPLVDRIPNLSVVASALSRRLSSSTSEYAISNRLVNGILYLCNQHATTTSAQKKPKQEDEKSSPDVHDLNPDKKPSHSTIQVAMAKLAFCIFVELPLECCRENSSSSARLKNIRSLLGSYKGTNKSGMARNDHQEAIRSKSNEDESSKINDEEKVDATESKPNPSGDDAQEQIETEEVWAAESDPSDFDYGEGSDDLDTNTWMQPESDMDWLDPKVLSKPDPDTTLQQMKDAIGSLLQHASYTLLEPIFCLSQKETSQFISKLTQLVLVLLQPRNDLESSDDDNSLLVGSSMDDSILSPLWILRDAAIYHGKSTVRKTTASKYEQSYLQVLQTLLAMDQAHLQDVGKLTLLRKKEEPDLCVSSIVGLSSLSSWCASQTKATQMTIDAIVDSMNDLEHIIERGQLHYKSNLPNTLVPILETLSGIHYDHLTNNNAATIHCYRGSTIPQTLLNSGLLRQLLALVASIESENSNALGFHHALWGLCIAYPKIVGKYVFRHSASSRIIRSYGVQLDASVAQNCVQCILWNVYGWRQCKDGAGSGSGGLGSLRKPGSVAPKKLTQDECSEVCQKAWTRLFRLVKEALVDSSTKKDATCERVIEEWGRLLVLVSGTYIAEDFKTLVDTSLLSDVSNVISNQMSQHSSNARIESSNDNDGKEDDDKPSRKQKTVSQAHKLLKKYNLFFQGATSGSSKTD